MLLVLYFLVTGNLKLLRSEEKKMKTKEEVEVLHDFAIIVAAKGAGVEFSAETFNRLNFQVCEISLRYMNLTKEVAYKFAELAYEVGK